MTEKKQYQPQPMNIDYYSVQQQYNNPYDIDLFDLAIQSWKKKSWIVGCAIIVTLLSAIYAFTAKEQWTATATIDAPSFNSIENYYQAYQLIEDGVDRGTTLDTIGERLFKQFISQAGSYNELSNYIRKSTYFQEISSEKSEQNKTILLNEIIDNIKIVKDKDDLIYYISFSADSANQAKNLLAGYMETMASNVSQIQYSQLKTLISNKKNNIKNQMDALKKIAEEQRVEEIDNIKMALAIAEKSNIKKPELNGMARLDNNNLFLLGSDALSAMFGSIKNKPLALDGSYYNLQRQYINLDKFKVDGSGAQAFNYLKNPSEPISRDKPKRIFIIIAGCILGGFIGAGYVLISVTIQVYSKRYVNFSKENSN